MSTLCYKKDRTCAELLTQIKAYILESFPRQLYSTLQVWLSTLINIYEVTSLFHTPPAVNIKFIKI